MTAGQPEGEVEQSDQDCRYQAGVTRRSSTIAVRRTALLRCIIFSNCVAELVNRCLSSPSDHVRSGSSGQRRYHWWVPTAMEPDRLSHPTLRCSVARQNQAHRINCSIAFKDGLKRKTDVGRQAFHHRHGISQRVRSVQPLWDGILAFRASVASSITCAIGILRSFATA
jgi:hypothetical protein